MEVKRRAYWGAHNLAHESSRVISGRRDRAQQAHGRRVGKLGRDKQLWASFPKKKELEKITG